MQVGVCRGGVLPHQRSQVGTAVSLKLGVKSGGSVRSQVEQVLLHAGADQLLAWNWLVASEDMREVRVQSCHSKLGFASSLPKFRCRLPAD